MKKYVYLIPFFLVSIFVSAQTMVFNVREVKAKDYLENKLEGRWVAFGTYDINYPNGATHWVGVSGKDDHEHIMLYDELQKQDDFYTLISERGEVERVGDVEYEMIKSFRMEEN